MFLAGNVYCFMLLVCKLGTLLLPSLPRLFLPLVGSVFTRKCAVQLASTSSITFLLLLQLVSMCSHFLRTTLAINILFSAFAWCNCFFHVSSTCPQFCFAKYIPEQFLNASLYCITTSKEVIFMQVH